MSASCPPRSPLRWLFRAYHTSLCPGRSCCPPSCCFVSRRGRSAVVCRSWTASAPPPPLTSPAPTPKRKTPAASPRLQPVVDSWTIRGGTRAPVAALKGFQVGHDSEHVNTCPAAALLILIWAVGWGTRPPSWNIFPHYFLSLCQNDTKLTSNFWASNWSFSMFWPISVSRGSTLVGSPI